MSRPLPIPPVQVWRVYAANRRIPALSQDELIGALVGLARAQKLSGTSSKSADRTVTAGLFTTITNVNFSSETVKAMTARVRAEKDKLITMCGGCGSECTSAEYDVRKIWDAEEDIRSLKAIILYGIKGMAAYAYHAMVLGFTDREVSAFFLRGAFGSRQ